MHHQQHAASNASPTTCITLSSSSSSIFYSSLLPTPAAHCTPPSTAVVDSNLVASLIHLIRNGGIDIKREATTAIANATCGSLDQIQFLVEQGCISALCGLLTCPDNRAECLRGLRNILKVGVKLNGVSLYAPMFVQQSGAVELIMNLRTRDNASGMADQSAAEMISMFTDDIRRILSHR